MPSPVQIAGCLLWVVVTIIAEGLLKWGLNLYRGESTTWKEHSAIYRSVLRNETAKRRICGSRILEELRAEAAAIARDLRLAADKVWE